MKIKNPIVKVIMSAFLLQVIFLSTSCGQIENKHEEEGEESGTRYSQSETCDEVRKGVQLILKYDELSSAFIGTIKNVSKKLAKKVRIEVHLSNGVELGPTKPINLKPGNQSQVTLSAKDQSFTWWSAHAESGSSEKGHGEEREGEHGEEGEHD